MVGLEERYLLSILNMEIFKKDQRIGSIVRFVEIHASRLNRSTIRALDRCPAMLSRTKQTCCFNFSDVILSKMITETFKYLFYIFNVPAFIIKMYFISIKFSFLLYFFFCAIFYNFIEINFTKKENSLSKIFFSIIFFIIMR